MSLQGSTMRANITVVQQVRNLSGRRFAYPFYPFKRLGRQNTRPNDTNLKYAMRQFLGPKNYKGEYAMNKYAKVTNDHVPNYIKPDLEKGQALEDPVSGKPLVERHDGTYEDAPMNVRMTKISRQRLLQPFPENSACRTNHMLSDELKLQIFNDITTENMSTQQVSQKYGLKVPRIEAVVKLVDIEQKWTKYNRISPEMKTMAETLKKMFPVYEPKTYRERENLSEIPVPPSALQSRFLTIAESQPFGPIDAAEVMELEPAANTLKRLATVGEHSKGHSNTNASKSATKKIVYGEVLQGERSMFRFTQAKVGKVGYRYGTVNRDNKRDRKVDFDQQGKMIYV